MQMHALAHQHLQAGLPQKRSCSANGRCHQVPRLPRKVTVHVTKCHACHAERRSMSPSATLATQSAAATTAPTRTQARHQSQPSAISDAPATQSEGRRRQVDVAKCHTCHAKRRSMSPSATPATQSAATRASPVP